MENSSLYKQYPLWLIFACNLLSIAIYGLGIFIIAPIGMFWVFLYVLFILVLEYRRLRFSCRDDSDYYGRNCAFGRETLCARLFSKGDPEHFMKQQIAWESLMPDFLVFLIPLFIGIALLVLEFFWSLLFILIALVILSFWGNAYVRALLRADTAGKERLDVL